MTDIPIKIQFVKSLSTVQPSRIIAVKADGDTAFSLWVTDKTGIPYPLKESAGGTITAIQNTDGKLVITGNETKTINVAPSLLNLIDSADKNWVYTQNTPNNVWSITHPLNKFPSVSIKDSAGTNVYGEINYIDISTLTITFNSSFSGVAILN